MTRIGIVALVVLTGLVSLAAPSQAQQSPSKAPAMTPGPTAGAAPGTAAAQADIDNLLKSFGFTVRQEGGERVVEVTLPQVLQMALERNLSLQAVRYGETVASSVLRAAEGRFNPTLTSGFEYGRTRSPSSVSPLVKSVSGCPGSGSALCNAFASLGDVNAWSLYSQFSKPTDTGTSYSLKYEELSDTVSSKYTDTSGALLSSTDLGSLHESALTGSVNIPFGQGAGRQFNAIPLHRAQAGVTGSKITTAQNALSLVQSTASTYWDLVAAIENMRVQQDAVKLSKQLLQDNQQRLKAGVLSPFDVQVTETQLAHDQSGLVAAKADVLRIEDVARSVLDLQNADFQVRPKDRPEVHRLKLDYPTLLKKVYANSPAVKQLENQLHINSLDLEEARNKDLTNLDLNLYYTAQGVSNGVLKGVSGFSKTGLDSYGATLTWTVPLEDVEIPEAIRQRVLQRQQLQLQLASQKSDLNVSLQSTLRQLKVATEQADSAQVARKLAEEQLKNEIERFRVGESTSFQVSQSQQNALSAQVQEILARLTFERDYLQLLALTGDIYRQYGLKPPSS